VEDKMKLAKAVLEGGYGDRSGPGPRIIGQDLLSSCSVVFEGWAMREDFKRYSLTKWRY
jgi:hypothetical protein